MIGVVRYGLGNPRSVLNMLRKVGATADEATTPEAVEKADKLVLPGVGAFDHGMRLLRQAGLVPALQHRVIEQRVPVLGICLGMQLFGKSSEEGSEPGLGWLDATARRFVATPTVKVPHMGWNRVQPASHPLFAGLEVDARFYFVHSYRVAGADPKQVIATCDHGETFAAAIAEGHIIGVQFHPEKSHRFGMQLMRNFAELG